MRLYFIGSQSCGKSTLARFIAKQINFPFISEVARTILAEKELSLQSLRTNLDIADDFQKCIFERQIEAEKQYPKFVSDRSFDNLAYMAQHARTLHKFINSESLLNYIESLKSDSILFFVRPSRITVADDGVREKGSSSQETWEEIIRIDAMVKFMLEMFNLDYINISCSSMQERVKLVSSVLKLSNISLEHKPAQQKASSP